TGGLPLWLSLSQMNGFGTATIAVLPVNLNGLEEGVYQTELEITSGETVVYLPITMNLQIFLYNPFASGGLFFTRDLDYFRFHTLTAFTYIYLIVTVKVYKINTNEEVTYQRFLDLPLYKKRGEFHLGEI